MTAIQFTGARIQVLSDAGVPLASGKVYVYEPGTTVLKTSWSDSAKSAANTNPVILDAGGRAQIYTEGTFKVRIDTSADVTLLTEDNLRSPIGQTELDDATAGIRAYDTLAAAQAASRGSDTWSELKGYASVGDGGGALYRYVVSEPAHAFKFQHFDSAWMENAEPRLNPRMIGGVGDGTTDDKAVLDNCIAATVGGDTIDLMGLSWKYTGAWTGGAKNWVHGSVIASNGTFDYSVDTSSINMTLAQKADIDSETLTGTPRTTTPPTSDNSTRIASTAFVNAALADKPSATVSDQKASGTAGGTSSVGDNIRVLNTITTDIVGASLASNLLTLPAGRYLAVGSAPTNNSLGHQLKLEDAAGNTLVNGSSAYSTSQVTNSHLFGEFTLSTSTDVRLAHYCAQAHATSGLGLPVTSGEPEVYATLTVWRLNSGANQDMANTFDTIADVQGVTVNAAIDLIFVRGYYGVGDAAGSFALERLGGAPSYAGYIQDASGAYFAPIRSPMGWNVLYEGAKGDNTANDRQAILNAIEKAGDDGIGVAFCPPGLNYRLEGGTIPLDSSKLRLEFSGSTITNDDASASDLFVVAATGHRNHIAIVGGEIWSEATAGHILLPGESYSCSGFVWDVAKTTQLNPAKSWIKGTYSGANKGLYDATFRGDWVQGLSTHSVPLVAISADDSVFNRIVFENLRITPSSGALGAVAFDIECTGAGKWLYGIVWRNMNFQVCDNGAVILKGGKFCGIEDCVAFDNATLAASMIDFASDGDVGEQCNHCWVTNWFRSAGTEGAFFDVDLSDASETHLENIDARGSAGARINVNSTRCRIDGCGPSTTLSNRDATNSIVTNYITIQTPNLQVNYPPIIPVHTVAGVPAAASYTNGVIIVSNEAGGRTIATSDGTNWRRASDGAIIST